MGNIDYLYACPPLFWWDATGIKLKKTVTEGATITTTEYRGGFQYTDGELDFVQHGEGYVKATANTSAVPRGGDQYNYVFNYVDHLGNIRLRYAIDPDTDEVAILEENHYYPFGLKHKGYNGAHRVFTDTPGGTIELTPVTSLFPDTYNYKFGGKELQTEFGITMYDFGARNYDPALGRWMNMDPLAELMRRYSPYAYAYDNPVFFVDPDGMFGMSFGANLSFSSIGGGELNAQTNMMGGLGGLNDDFSKRMNAKSRSRWDVNFGPQPWAGNASGGGPGDPPKVYNGPSVATGGAINPLPEVVVSTKKSNGNNSGGGDPDIGDAGWFIEGAANGIKQKPNLTSPKPIDMETPIIP